jgi:hypothetical protein
VYEGRVSMGEKYRVARGFEDTWGNERNSSRSIVPLLSCVMEKDKSASLSLPERLVAPCPIS